MSKNELDKILDRVKKLLALAGNNPNQHEAASAAEMAHRILTEYNLSLSDVELKDIVEGKVKFNTIDVEKWYGILAVNIAKVFDCYTYKINYTDTKDSESIFIGTKSDVEVAIYVYKYLTTVCHSLIAEKDVDVRVSYSLGLVKALCKRITDFYGKQRKKNDTVVGASGKTGKELMVIKQDALANYLEEQGRANKYPRRKDHYKVDAFNEGVFDAQGISLTHGIKSSGRKTEGYLTRG